MRIVDLSLPIRTGMMTFPSRCHPSVEVTPLGRLDRDGRATHRLTLGTHTGTHVDAPAHFLAGAEGVDSLPLDLLVGPAVLVDLTGVPARTAISRGDIVERLSGRRPARLVLRTGWSARYGEQDYYTDYPYLSEESARWIVDGGVRLLGLDTPSPDDPRQGRGSDADSPLHKMLLAAGVVLVEYLSGLERVAGDEFELVALPLKVVGADGAPARCIAIERDDDDRG